jgi:hypothetical protein
LCAPDTGLGRGAALAGPKLARYAAHRAAALGQRPFVALSVLPAAGAVLVGAGVLGAAGLGWVAGVIPLVFLQGI